MRHLMWDSTNGLDLDTVYKSGYFVLGTVRVFRQKFTLDEPMELHGFAPLEALPCV
jgi:hypothetical protein